MTRVILRLLLEVVLSYVLPLFSGMVFGFGGMRLALRALQPVRHYHTTEKPDSITPQNAAAARDSIRSKFNRGLSIIIFLMMIAILEAVVLDVSDNYVPIVFFTSMLVTGAWAAYWAHRYEHLTTAAAADNQ